MGKPSIFSRDYEKRMRRRRKSITIIGIVILLSAVLLLTLGSGNVAKWVENININKRQQNEKNANSTPKGQTELTPASNADNGKKTEDAAKGGYDVTLSDGTVIKAVYESKDESKKFKYIDPVSSNVPYSINPSGNVMVLYDASAQNMVIVDIDGKIKDITRQNYTSSKDGTVYPKNDILKNNPGYVWCASPTFIDDGSIAYISELPWFNNQSAKYVWVVKTEDSSNKQTINASGAEVSGQNIKFGSLSDKGLEVTVDDKIYYVKSDGSIVE